LFLSSIFLKQLLLKNCAVDFVEICNVCAKKAIFKVAKRKINSDKICHSYSDLNFAVTFFGTQCIYNTIQLCSVFSCAVLRGRSVHRPEAARGHSDWNSTTTRVSAQSASGSVPASHYHSTSVSSATGPTRHRQLRPSYVLRISLYSTVL